jgi:hypothetical protein
MTSLEAIAQKLVSTFHLDASERGVFSGGVPGTLVQKAVLDLLAHHRKFPPRWSLEKPFDGAFLMLRPDGTCQVTWKGEVGMGRYETIETSEYPNAEAAVESYVRRFFGRDVDGIPIDWST